MIATSGLAGLLVTIVIAGLVFYLLFWLLGVIGLPEPFGKVATVILALCAVLFLIDMLLRVGGHPLFRY